MTVYEHLSFSVLTAPLAAVDRRALSQAWYSALYGDTNAAQAPAVGKQSPSAAAPHRERPVPGLHEQRFPTHVRTAIRVRLPEESAGGGQVERRSPHSALARKIERALWVPKTCRKNAAFTITGEHGRVQVVLSRQGAQAKLIAICASKSVAQVARALAQARFALAARGIRLEAETRETHAC